MAEITPGTALRNLQQAQATMRKARQAMALARKDASPEVQQRVLKAGWESLINAHKVLAAIPLGAADDAVMTKTLAVQRYATALLVRLRRIARKESGPIDEEDEDFDDSGD